MRRMRSRPGAAGLALAGLLGGAACSDFDRVLDIAFPPQIGGLPGDAAWAALPIGSWITESGVEATAMAACFAPRCGSPAVVAAYRVEGREVRLLDELVSDPARLVRAIEERDRRDPNAKRRKLRVAVAAEPFSAQGYRGILVRLARQDGTHPAVGVLVARPAGSGRQAILVIGPERDAALGVLRSVLAART